MKPKLTPPDFNRCQVMRYHPFVLGGNCHEQCNNKPDWIVSETKPASDGLMGSQSSCQRCRDEHGDELDASWKWERIEQQPRDRATDE